jgi:hypothetical protein
MKVLVIASYDDHKSGFHTAVVERPPDKSEDEVFIAWYNSEHKTAHTVDDLGKNDCFLHGYTTSTVQKVFP